MAAMVDGLKLARAARVRMIGSGHPRELQLVRDMTGTLATKLAVLVLGFVSNIIIARILGPEGRGVYVLAFTTTALGVQFGNLGLHASNTYYVARDRQLLGRLLSNTLVFSGIVGGVAMLCGATVSMVAPSLLPVSGTLLILALVWVPIGLAYLLMQSLLVGTGAIRTFNTVEVGAPALALSLFLAAILLQDASPELFFAITVGSQCLAALLVSRALSGAAEIQVSPSPTLFRETFLYGAKAYVAALLSFLVLRSDLLLVQHMLGAEQTGQYSVAVLIADTIYLLPVAVGSILFPRLSVVAVSADRLKIAVRVSIVVGLLTLAAAVAAGVLATMLVHVVFGEQFSPAVPAILWLLPGVVSLSINTIFMNYFASAGMPRITIVSPALALLVNLLINLVLIPQYGIVGASVASSVAYSLMLVCSIVYILKRRTAM